MRLSAAQAAQFRPVYEQQHEEACRRLGDARLRARTRGIGGVSRSVASAFRRTRRRIQPAGSWRAPFYVAQHNLLRYHSYMPVATARKVEALRHDFRSGARLADLLGVSRSQITRWLRGAGIDPLNAEKIDLLELVWGNLLRLYERDAALAWLFGVNPLIGDRRPIDLIRAGRAEELMRAIRAERADTFA